MCLRFRIYAGERTTKEKAKILVMALGLVEQQLLTRPRPIKGWRWRGRPLQQSSRSSSSKLSCNSRK